MTRSTEFREQLIAAIPGLRAFGLSLTARGDRADDLVQETLMKAWKHYESFEPGSNMKAWLYTILRNEFYTQLRKRKREVEDADGFYSSRVAVHAEQDGHLDMADLAVFPASQSILWQQAIAMGLPLIVGNTGHQDISYLNLYDNIIILEKTDIQVNKLVDAIESVIGPSPDPHFSRWQATGRDGILSRGGSLRARHGLRGQSPRDSRARRTSRHRPARAAAPLSV